jgi:iron complex outermembrane receptor protein
LKVSLAYLNARYTKYDQAAAPFGTSILIPDATALTATVVNGVTIAPIGQRRLFAAGYNCGFIPGTGGAGQPGAAYGCDLSGNKIAHSPDFSGSVSAQYDIDLGGAGTLSPYAQLNFSSSFFGQPINSILDKQQGFVTNVTNKSTATRFVYGSGGALQAGGHRASCASMTAIMAALYFM